MNKASLYIPLGVFALLVIILAAGFGLRDPHYLPSEMVGRPLPQFSLMSLNNPDEVVSSQDIIGKPTLINVWATWCPSCVVEHPFLLKLAAEGKVRIIGVNYNDDPIKARAWLKQRRDPYWVTVSDDEGKLSIDLGVYGAPETFLMDAKGVIHYRHVGVVNASVWNEQLWPMIESFED